MTPVLSVVACAFMLYGLPLVTWLWFGIWVAVVLAFYFVWGRHHSALNRRRRRRDPDRRGPGSRGRQIHPPKDAL